MLLQVHIIQAWSTADDARVQTHFLMFFSLNALSVRSLSVLGEQ